jgi:lipid-A-disaccharide synthase
MRIGIVAGEASGDILAAGLIRAIKASCPDAEFEGIAGQLMMAEGCESLYPLEKLSVFGLFEVLKDLPELLKIRRDLCAHLLQDPPDLFIGIDAPDFNIGLETKLREQGIKTVHYVAPTVWAWRQYRVHGIARAVDLMLCIFPFEKKFFEKFNMHAEYVGHPLAQDIPLEIDRQTARKELGLDAEAEYLALLPGSRRSEVSTLGMAFLQTAEHCLRKRPDLKLIVPMATVKTREIFQAQLDTFDDLPLTIFDGQSDKVLAAADVVLTASGTATLEALLYKRPMVIAYKLSHLTYWVVKLLKLVKISNFAMANLVADKPLSPEYIQYEVIPENMAKSLLEYLENPEKMMQLQQDFLKVHENLRQNSSEIAAQFVLQLANQK